MFRWVPEAYRFPVALMLIAAAIMIVPLAFALVGNPATGSSSTTTT
jgi:hypothetical protein